MPVLSQDHQLSGVMTEDSLMRNMLEREAEPVGSETIEAIVDPEVKTCSPSASIQSILQDVITEKYALVVNDRGTPIDIITMIDIINDPGVIHKG